MVVVEVMVMWEDKPKTKWSKLCGNRMKKKTPETLNKEEMYVALYVY